MCHSGECPYEHEETGKCTLPERYQYYSTPPDDSACSQRRKDFIMWLKNKGGF